MCGIAGIVRFEEPVDQALLRRMCTLIAHRGPDDTGVFVETTARLSVGLGAQRLSIIDLSPAGHMPMCNESGDIIVVYNGEIYNHENLRTEMERKGHTYRSRTDTETVIHAYEEYGMECLNRLNGMFAFALYNQKLGSLILARDRRGIKPLYYCWDGHRLAFASELKALLKANLVRPHIDPTALWLFLCLGYVPSPYSIVSGVHKLEPGHYLELKDSQLQIVRYAPEADPLDRRHDEREAVSLVRTSVEQAVQRQLMSDVPVGVFLSGGLDSTIVATLASRYHRETLHTFSVGYARAEGAAEIDAHYNDDFFFARQISESLGTVHHEVVVENSGTLTDLFAQLIFQLDEPMVEPVFTSTHYLSKLARKCGVPVVLTGDGADELFGGYDRYFSAQRLARYRQIPGLHWVLPFIETAGGSREIARSAHELKYLLDNPTAIEGYVRFSSIYRPEQALRLLAPNARVQVDTQALYRLVASSLGPDAPFVDQMGHADLVLWVGEHFNPRLDRISMLHSVEARVPFQDDAVVEMALSIPTALKSNRHARKGLLKQAFADIIPVPARTRPKRSFQAPGAAWLQGGLSDLYHRLVEQEGFMTEIFDPAQVRYYVHTWGKDTPGEVFAVSALLIAQLWAEQYQGAAVPVKAS